MKKLWFKSDFFPKASNWKFWCLIALFFKLLLLLFFLDGSNNIVGFFGFFGGDSIGYTEPIENLIKEGNYSPDFRMPGYGLFYLILHYFLPKAIALNALIVFQLLLDSITVYLLARIAQLIFKRKLYFYCTFFLYAISTYTSIWNSHILTESLSTSFLIITVFFLLKYIKNHKLSYLFLSGLTITEVIFLKPVFAPLILLMIIILIKHSVKEKQLITKTLIFISSFLIIDGSWMIRNYIHHNKVTLFTTTIIHPSYESDPYYLTWNFLKSWGGSHEHWDTGSEIRWFGKGADQHFGKGVDKSAKIPDYIYTSKFNLDSLKLIREKLVIYDQLTSFEKIKCRNEIKKSMDKYTQSIKDEKPFLFYVKAPLILTHDMLIHSGTYNLFSKSAAELNTYEYIIKVFYSLLYLVTLIMGFLGLLLMTKKSILFHIISLITGIFVYTIVIHSIIFRFTEARYFVPAWPFVVICAVYSVIWTYKKIYSSNKLTIK
ncbi:MAG: hypothetical protein COB15_00390 [Flavobacteriales bacterium]|nr:MAG: hypothetical protein COB15_00390 [Flavobacteriales bacterium]